MFYLKRWLSLIFRLLVWSHLGIVLFGLFFGLLYTLLPPGISSLQLYRSWVEGTRPRYPVRFVQLDRLHPQLLAMLIAVEDGKFLLHRGLDIESMKEAWKINRQLGYYASGASTLTQQLVRTLFLFPKKWLVRKYVEVWLALSLEMVMPKERIAELYLNMVEWGPGIYGIEAAARHWFKKPASSLGVGELARLVAILPNPIKFTPHSFWRRPELYWRWQCLWQAFGQRPVQQVPVIASNPVSAPHAKEGLPLSDATNTTLPALTGEGASNHEGRQSGETNAPVLPDIMEEVISSEADAGLTN